jgi:spore cortex formation protein SpoVR/YcgB (stage V sporulation)
MKLGKAGCNFRTGHRKAGPIRVSYVQQKGHKLVVLIRFATEVAKAARWQIGDIVDVDLDDNGNMTISRAKKGWKLSGKNDKADTTIRFTVELWGRGVA